LCNASPLIAKLHLGKPIPQRLAGGSLLPDYTSGRHGGLFRTGTYLAPYQRPRDTSAETNNLMIIPFRQRSPVLWQSLRLLSRNKDPDGDLVENLSRPRQGYQQRVGCLELAGGGQSQDSCGDMRLVTMASPSGARGASDGLLERPRAKNREAKDHQENGDGPRGV
jgi:hypothetical protein